jgi:hypothetical protein
MYIGYQKSRRKPVSTIIKPGGGGTYCSRTIDLRGRRAQTEDQLRLHYGPDFSPWKESVLEVMAKKCAGIHLLRGEPGTGKTSFIRHLIEVLRTTHRFYFLPSYEYSRVGNGALIEFLHDEQDQHPNLQFVIVMEDADDFRLLTHLEAIELAQHLGLPVPQQRREYSLAEIYNPDEQNVREMLAAHIGFLGEN